MNRMVHTEEPGRDDLTEEFVDQQHLFCIGFVSLMGLVTGIKIIHQDRLRLWFPLIQVKSNLFVFTCLEKRMVSNKGCNSWSSQEGLCVCIELHFFVVPILPVQLHMALHPPVIDLVHNYDTTVVDLEQ